MSYVEYDCKLVEEINTTESLYMNSQEATLENLKFGVNFPEPLIYSKHAYLEFIFNAKSVTEILDNLKYFPLKTQVQLKNCFNLMEYIKKTQEDVNDNKISKKSLDHCILGKKMTAMFKCEMVELKKMKHTITYGWREESHSAINYEAKIKVSFKYDLDYFLKFFEKKKNKIIGFFKKNGGSNRFMVIQENKLYKVFAVDSIKPHVIFSRK